MGVFAVVRPKDSPQDAIYHDPNITEVRYILEGSASPAVSFDGSDAQQVATAVKPLFTAAPPPSNSTLIAGSLDGVKD